MWIANSRQISWSGVLNFLIIIASFFISSFLMLLSLYLRYLGCSNHSWMDIWCNVSWFIKSGWKQICAWGNMFLSIYSMIRSAKSSGDTERISFFRFLAKNQVVLKRRKFFWKIMILSGLSSDILILQRCLLTHGNFFPMWPCPCSCWKSYIWIIYEILRCHMLLSLTLRFSGWWTTGWQDDEFCFEK